ncbi:PEGA domain-containing protein [Candidatus Falkowbacteria bacterium]|nr:PEGA domain-containing protein [Candidatus Falkowbacteria bacterium]
MLSLRVRRIIYLGFIILFLATAPLLVLYTAGYRYNFKKTAIQKVGALSVKPQPATADIYLNGQRQVGSRSDNTLRLNNLLPGQYQVTVSLDGYYPWEKTLEVSSNVNTFVNQAVLFKNNPPENIIDAPISQSLASTDKQLLAFQTSPGLQLINLNNEQVSLLNQESDTAQLIAWSPDNANLLIKTEGQFIILNINNPDSPLSLQAMVPTTFISLTWDPQANYLLYGLDDRYRLYQINILTKTNRLLYTLPQQSGTRYGSDVLFRNNLLYFTARDPQGWFLETLDISATPASPLKLMKLSDGNITFRTNGGNIVLMNEQSHRLYLLDDDFTKILLEADAKDLDWSTDGQTLLYYNDFELWLYRLSDNSTTLITRYGQTIQQARLVPTTEYLAVTANNTLQIIELDGRDRRNVTSLVKGLAIHQFIIANKAKDIFFTGTIGSQSGLFKLTIQ